MLMAEIGEQMIMLAEPPVIMNIKELGPALFNREGDYTSANHCISLAFDINKVQGFADYKYECIYAHEPDPSDMMAVARHVGAKLFQH